MTFYSVCGDPFDEKAAKFLHEMQCQHWHPKELDFVRDRADFASLPEPLHQTLKNLLAFFAFGDGVVDMVLDLVKERTRIPEVRAFYAAQEANEIVHGQTYGNMLLELITDDKERDYILNNIGKQAMLQHKLDWVAKWTNSKQPMAVLIGAMLVIEQMWFSTAFNIINWLRVLNKMPEMVKANEFIIRDENLHGEFAAYILNEYFKFPINESLQKLIFQMIREAEEAELLFIEAITKHYEDLDEALYRGISFDELRKHLNMTIKLMNKQLHLGVRENTNAGTSTALLTAMGSGRPNFFEFTAPNYQIPLADAEVDNVFNDAFK